jgi:hypothetical protein
MASILKFLALAVALLAVMMPSPAAAQVTTGQNGVCCSYIMNSTTTWQLVCNNPTNVSLLSLAARLISRLLYALVLSHSV